MDTKYEFGKGSDGEIYLIDEVGILGRLCSYIHHMEDRYSGQKIYLLIRLPCQIHTPDSSRYWISDTYSERHSKGMEPENIDKEFLRLWFRSVCDPYKDKASV